ncbi:MAG: phage tail protein [Polyangiaceae bacterium]
MSNSELFYSLIPRIYRTRDYAIGQPLRAFARVLEEQFDVLSSNFAQTYDNWFIETCEPWVIPYIAEMIQSGDHALDVSTVERTRALVANMIGYRRRKGTVLALENAVADYTGAPALAIEGIDVLSFTQNVRAPLPGKGRTFDVRPERETLWVRTPFSRAAHTVDVRAPRSALEGAVDPGALAAMPNAVALYLWRLASFPVQSAEPARVGVRRYTFDPSGRDAPLFNPPADDLVAHSPDEAPRSYPEPIRREVLACRLAEPGTSTAVGFAIFRQRLPGARELRHVAPACMLAADLSDWSAPRPILCPHGQRPSAVEVLVDPELGRFYFEPDPAVDAIDRPTVLVDYAYGFSADIGAGPFPRPTVATPPTGGTWTALVGKHALLSDRHSKSGVFTSVTAAIDAWLASSPMTWPRAIVTITDSAAYDLGRPNGPEGVFELELDGRHLVLQASGGTRPLIRGVIDVDRRGRGGSLELNGLLVDGALLSSPEVVLTLTTTTLLPYRGEASIVVRGPSGDSARDASGMLALDRCITGPLRVSSALPALHIASSIVDACGGLAIAGSPSGFGPRTTLERVTLFGETDVCGLEWGTDILSTGPLRVQRATPGYVQFSWLPPGSVLPLTHDVYPENRAPASPYASPRFVSTRFGAPGYAQVSLDSPEPVSKGGSSGGQLGAFAGQSLGDLDTRDEELIAEFLRIGFRAGVNFVT